MVAMAVGAVLFTLWSLYLMIRFAISLLRHRHMLGASGSRRTRESDRGFARGNIILRRQGIDGSE